MFALPAPRRYRLDRPPLAQALARVDFDVRARLESLDGVAPVQEALSELFPYMDELQQQEVGVVFGPGGLAASPQVAPPRRTWRFTDDHGWSVAVAAASATLAVGSEYGTVDEITERFQTMVRAVASGGGARRCTRLGVRYINLAGSPPGDPGAWRSWFRPELVGWAATDIVSGDLVASIEQTQLSARPEGELADMPGLVQGMIRNGFVPSGTLVPGLAGPLPAASYLLDIDVFVQDAQPMQDESLSQQFGILHGQIDRFFRWTLTPAGEDYFGLQEVHEE